MRESPKLKALRFHPAGPKDRARGVRGWVSFEIEDSLHVDGVVVLRESNDRHTVEFPSRLDHGGRRHPIVSPISVAVRDSIETQVLEYLRGGGWI